MGFDRYQRRRHRGLKAAVAACAVVAAAGTFLAAQAGAAQVTSNHTAAHTAAQNLRVHAPAGAACLAVVVKDTHAQLAVSLVQDHPSFLVESAKAADAHWVNTRHRVQPGQWVRVIAFASDCAGVANQKFAHPLLVSKAQRVLASNSPDDWFAPDFAAPTTPTTTSTLPSCASFHWPKGAGLGPACAPSTPLVPDLSR